MTVSREPWLKPIAFAKLCFAAPEGTAPLTKDQGLPPSQALKGLSYRGVASKLAATRLGHAVVVPLRRAGGAGGVEDGDGEVELRAAADFAFDPDAAAMHFDDVLGDGEAQAGAAELAGARSVDAIEALEDARLVGGGDANAGIGDGEDDFGAAGLGADRDLAARERVLRGVVEQILQDFREAATVAGDVGHAVEGRDGNGDFSFGGAMARGFHAGFDKLRDADAADFELQAVGVHFREHEQVFGEAREAARMLDDNFEKAPAMLRIVHGPGEQRFREALNGGERGAKFVGDVGDEIAADAFELAQLGDVVKDHDGAGSFAGARRGDGGSEKMLPQRPGDNFGFHARLAGQNFSHRFNHFRLTHHFYQGTARFGE